MAFTNAGYDGTVDEIQFAKLLNRYAVVGPDDFKASNTTGDRMLSIANGTALGPGTLNVGSAFSPIQFEAVSSGTRWDLVVLRRDWQPPGGTTSIAIIKGGSTPVIPARNTTPGVIDDQPLYLQQVNAGSTSLGTRIDLRVWLGPGGAEAGDILALTYLNQPGAAVKVGQTTHRYEIQANGVWGWGGYGFAEFANVPAPPNFSVGPAGFRVDKIPAGGGKSRFFLTAQLIRTGPSFGSNGGFMLGNTLPAGFRPPDALDFPLGLSYAPPRNYAGTMNVRVNPDGTMNVQPTYNAFTIEQWGNLNFSGSWVA